MSDKVQLSLFENGRDFLVTGLSEFFDYLADTSRVRRYKYGILHIYAGASLVLKARVERIDPNLVFKGRPGPSARTIGALEAIGILRTNGVAVEKDAAKAIDKLRNLRRSIEHADFAMDAGDAKAVVAKVTAFLFEFCREHLELDLLEDVSASAGQAIRELDRIAEVLWQEYLERWQEESDEYSVESVEFHEADPDSGGYEEDPCGHCGAPASLVEDDRIVCTTCGEHTLVEPCFCGNPATIGATCSYHAHTLSKDD